jgi:hypothetical protein
MVEMPGVPCKERKLAISLPGVTMVYFQGLGGLVQAGRGEVVSHSHTCIMASDTATGTPSARSVCSDARMEIGRQARLWASPYGISPGCSRRHPIGNVLWMSNNHGRTRLRE